MRENSRNVEPHENGEKNREVNRKTRSEANSHDSDDEETERVSLRREVEFCRLEN